ncbi:spermine oxidase isoform X2 [Pieris rapae]|uniref:spermine oxidase isoform X2 n=1 Tax=Pieris rapae TaxID=64459 RepID=UPI001E27ED05|nr:spermine oxidase isoform X2 [Pieris rapae]
MFPLRLVLVLSVANYGSCIPQPYDSIVVGMGSAGVTAATILAKAGKRVLGLEAMDRIGGRVKTVQFAGGIIEEGAEWIHGTQNSRVYDLAIQNNITVVPQDFDFLIFRSDGNQTLMPVYYELFNYCLEKSEYSTNISYESTGDYLTAEIISYIKKNHPYLEHDKQFIDEFLDVMNLFINAYEASNDWHDVTTRSTAEELGGHLHTSWHKYGYKTFFELMLNTYNNGPGLQNLDIKLNTEVTKIIWPKDITGEVTVVCADGQTYTANNVIVTVSLGVLKERYTTLFSPELPDDKITSIQKMSMGLLNKVILNFPHKWWDQNKIYVMIEADKSNDLWFTRHGDATTPLALDTALTIWLAGESAKTAETLTDEIVQQKSIELLRRFMGKNYTIPEPNGILRSKWYSNPFFRGSYTYDNLETPKYPKARENLGAPLLDASGTPRVLFAGEATNPLHYGTVHGASETGYREAMRLLNA